MRFLKTKHHMEAEKRHYAIIDKYERSLTLKYGDKVVAKSNNALILKEVGKSVYNPVFYFPKEDIKVELNQDLTYASSCPIKGEASYWTFEGAPNDTYIAWSYEEPLPRSRKIKGYIAFNINYISICSEPR
jgi:uncharacterized protein (DUF427 family)